METESDGRFSELLRGPAEGPAEKPETATNPTSNRAAASNDRPATEATPETALEAAPHTAPEAAPDTAPDTGAPIKTVTDPAAPVPAADDFGLDPLATLPEAITRSQPGLETPGVGNAIETAVLKAGATAAPMPTAGPPVVTPRNSAPTPAPAGASAPAIPAGDGSQGLQPSGTAAPGNPADRAIPAAPATQSAPAETTGPIAADRVARPSPVAGARQEITAPAAKAVAGGAGSQETIPTAAATVPKADTGDRPELARQPSAPVPTADRSAMMRSPAQIATDPSATSDPAEQIEVPDAKIGSRSTSTTPNLAVATNSATPAATPAGSGKPNTVPANSVPSTVSETADAPLPASQAESTAAAAPGQVGRMTIASASLSQTVHAQTTAQPAAEQVILQVQRAVREGIDRLTVQLKPASLGRVDVQMEVGFDGRLQAVISAERPDTLQLLQRDARALTEALNDAGLQTDGGSLSFNLRGQSGDRGGGGGQLSSDAARAGQSHIEDDVNDASGQITLTLGDGRVDIKV